MIRYWWSLMVLAGWVSATEHEIEVASLYKRIVDINMEKERLVNAWVILEKARENEGIYKPRLGAGIFTSAIRVSRITEISESKFK